MTERTPGWPDGATLKTLVVYLDDPEDQAQVWRGLHFMEANGLDLSLRYDELHGYLTSEIHSPLENAPELSHEDERAIVLALREIIRRNLRLPELTHAERAGWEYERLEPFRWPSEKLVSRTYGETYRPAPAEIAEFKERMSAEQPEIARALALFAEHNVPVDGQWGKVHSTLWLHAPLKRYFATTCPELDAIDVSNLEIAMMQEFWREAKKIYNLNIECE